MATLQVTIKDTIYTAALASMPGANDAARLIELKKYVKDHIKDRVRFIQERVILDAVAVKLTADLAALNLGLAE